MIRLFRDRREAGRKLARHLTAYANRPDVLVLALPRGGAPVAFEVAQALHAPLDVFIVRKIGAPGYEELALGALATGDIVLINNELQQALKLSQADLQALVKKAWLELERRDRAYRAERPPPEIAGRIIILVDDGLATGATMRAAVAALRQQKPIRIVVAVPTASPDICEELRAEADEVICAITPEPFHAVGLWYEDFSQTTDEEVRDLLRQAAQQLQPVG